MALDTPPKLRFRRQVAFDLETTNGTSPSLTGSNAVTPIFNPSMTYTQESVEREPEGHNSPVRQGRGAFSGTFTATQEIYNSGASGLPDWVKLLKGCGYYEATTGVFKPKDKPEQTVTVALYQDGLLKKLTGAMGTANINVRRGQGARINYTFTGIPATPTDTSIITPTKVTTIAPRVVATLTVGGTAYQIDQVDIDLGCQVVLREEMPGTNNSGYRCAMITGRAPRVRLAIEAKALADINWDSGYQASTTYALSVAIGSGSNSVVTIAAPAMELAGRPQDGDRQGMLTHNLEFIPTDDGDEELSITFS